ncbi:MAG: DUF2723 domain-containing protein [Deltaproteobacteria bacterium]|nr:DUF2723 domain-containing protein [Deltaproteobacteria bacterium]
MVRRAHGGTSETLAWALAVLGPLLAYLATASAHAYWLDSGEFVAAASDLGIAHPPGEVLATLTHYAACMVPLGSMAFRVALASACFAALAAGCVFHATLVTLESAEAVEGNGRLLLSVAASWLFAGSYGVWLQAVRPEVYALEAALVCFIADRLVCFEARRPSSDPRPLYVAALAFGLGLANHHFLTFLLLPAAAPTLARLLQDRGRRPLLRATGFALLGLSTFIYLPLRAAAGPSLNLGEPTSPARIFWVVSAEAFQKNQGAGVPLPLGERLADVVWALGSSVHAVTVVLALLGAWALLRTRGSARVAIVWLGLLLSYSGARAWLGFVHGNPDALGYLMPAMAALTVLAVSGVGVLATLMKRRGGLLGALAALLLLAAPLAALQHARATGPQVSLTSFADTDDFDDALRRDLPPRSVVLVHQAQTLFRFWGGESEELLRPDVTVVPIPLLAYPGMVNSLVAREPELADLLRGYLLEGTLRQPDLQSLAARRPLLVEMDTRVPPELYETMVPRQLYFQVLGAGASRGDEREGRQELARIWTRIDARVGRPLDDETRAQMLWRHYVEALYFAGFGDRDAARASVEAALALDPNSRELLGLQAALRPRDDDVNEERPLDVNPYRIGSDANEAPTR